MQRISTTHACERDQGICHVTFVIGVQMSNRYIMYFSVHALNIVWLLEEHLFLLRCAHTFLKM